MYLPEEIKWKEGDWALFEAILTASPFSSKIQNKNISSSVPSFQTNVKLSFEGVTAADSNPTSPWPKASSMEILRGTSPAGPYKAVKSINGTVLLNASQTEVYKQTSKGEKQSRKHYEMEFSDEDIKTEGRYFYKLRFFDGKKKLIYESGFCSVLVLHPPAVETAMDSSADSRQPASCTKTIEFPATAGAVDGYPRLFWKTQDKKSSEFIRPPKIVVRHLWFGELARFPMGKGSFKSPFKTNQHDVNRLLFHVGIEAPVRRDFWAMTVGQGQMISTERYLADLHFTTTYQSAPIAPVPSVTPTASARGMPVRNSKNPDASKGA
jgi:hypothetical protein